MNIDTNGTPKCAIGLTRVLSGRLQKALAEEFERAPDQRRRFDSGIRWVLLSHMEMMVTWLSQAKPAVGKHTAGFQMAVGERAICRISSGLGGCQDDDWLIVRVCFETLTLSALVPRVNDSEVECRQPFVSLVSLVLFE